MLKLFSLCPKVCCWLCEVRLGYGLWVGMVCGSKLFILQRAGQNWVSRLVGWVVLKKLDPRTTLRAIEELLLTYLLTSWWNWYWTASFVPPWILESLWISVRVVTSPHRAYLSDRHLKDAQVLSRNTMFQRSLHSYRHLMRASHSRLSFGDKVGTDFNWKHRQLHVQTLILHGAPKLSTMCAISCKCILYFMRLRVLGLYSKQLIVTPLVWIETTCAVFIYLFWNSYMYTQKSQAKSFTWRYTNVVTPILLLIIFYHIAYDLET